VSGYVYNDLYDDSPGSVYHFGYYIYGDPSVTTDQTGNVIVANAHVPDYWNMFVLWPFQKPIRPPNKTVAAVWVIWAQLTMTG
jgi:hypothetical protein